MMGEQGHRERPMDAVMLGRKRGPIWPEDGVDIRIKLTTRSKSQVSCFNDGPDAGG